MFSRLFRVKGENDSYVVGRIVVTTWKLLTLVQLRERRCWIAASNCCLIRNSEQRDSEPSAELAGQQDVKNSKHRTGPRSKLMNRWCAAALAVVVWDIRERERSLFLLLRMDLWRMGFTGLIWVSRELFNSWGRFDHLRLAIEGWCRKYCWRWTTGAPSRDPVAFRRRMSNGLRARSQHWSWPRSLLITKKELLLCHLKWKGIWKPFHFLLYNHSIKLSLFFNIN